jgi:hypothetical protein
MARESLEIAGGGVATIAIGAAVSQAFGCYLPPINVMAVCWTCMVSGLGVYLTMRVQDRWSIIVVLLLVLMGLAGPVVAAYQVIADPSMIS